MFSSLQAYAFFFAVTINIKQGRYITLRGLQTILKADNVCPHCTVQIECVMNTDFVLFIA